MNRAQETRVSLVSVQCIYNLLFFTQTHTKMLVNTTLHWWEPTKGLLKQHEGGNFSLYYIIEDDVSDSVQHRKQSLSVWQLTPCCRCAWCKSGGNKSLIPANVLAVEW